MVAKKTKKNKQDNKHNKQDNGKESQKSQESSLDADMVKYKNQKLGLPQGKEIPEAVKKEMAKTQAKLNEFKKAVLKKFNFTMAIGIIPPQAAEKFDEEENLTEEEKKEKPMHVLVIIPEEKFEQMGKIKLEMVKMVKDMKPKIWLQVKTPVDIWNLCLDGKYDLIEALSMSYPLFDKGFLGALRVATIHKSLVLKKFEKYVTSYVIAGSLVRGTASKTSDVDVYIIIDDTDVKRMPRLELKEKLRSIIYSYVLEAGEIAGVKNKLSPQIYILTDFWESVKDAHPVIFTFIRDGIPLYDRGAFLPWKLLLKMGKIKPSPEAIDMFMSMGDKVSERVKRTLLDLVVGDIYWGVLTPSQALLMLYGLPPPTPKETLEQVKKIFVEKEKLLELKYFHILEKIVTLYKDYEHEKIKKVTGQQVDDFLKDSEIYMKRLKELREQIEKRTQEKTLVQIYDDVFNLLSAIFNSKQESVLIRNFESELIKKGRLEPKFSHILRNIVKAKKEKKLDKQQVEDTRKNASLLINSLIEYSQRCELVNLDRTKLSVKYKDGKQADLLVLDKIFLIEKGKINKITERGLEASNEEEFNKSLMQQRQTRKPSKLNSETINLIEKAIGSFEIVL